MQCLFVSLFVHSSVPRQRKGHVWYRYPHYAWIKKKSAINLFMLFVTKYLGGKKLKCCDCRKNKLAFADTL